ncbi:MAG: aminotransferase class I/II-fold pyridoxal phosphate-dependent enzyme [Clostridia bacterium]|nr:aminotransferase class I/II-fold pyridoxal phosphate-dependent enzyme [Clostridia bacterium]
MISFACDYLEGAHPAVLEALVRTNAEQTVGYGLDPHCLAAAEMIRARFAVPEAAVHFAVGGTQVNTLVIAATLRPYEGVLCADSGHINVHETGAPEATGHKILPLPPKDGKITGAQVREAMKAQADFEHTVRPGMVYISISTEVGTVYTLAELAELYDACREEGLYLYVDGARLGTGLASPDTDLTPETLAAHCDAFTIGGTKNGALFGEALVLRHPGLQPRFRYMLKRQGAMLAKGRLLGVQYEALMRDDLYFEIGRKETEQALRIREALLERGIPLWQDTKTNQLFPILTSAQRSRLEEGFALEPWAPLPDGREALRIATSWATTDEAVDALIRAIRAL